MPIRIPDALPAAAQLESENIFVMTEYRALHQDIRPLRVLILNLMPTKIATETQIMRKLSNTPLQVEVDLLRTKTHEATHVSAGHLETFYRTFDDIRDIHYDGLIITGAPVEQMPFEEVDYWPELCQIMDWSTTHVHSTLHICWGAQAGLYHHYGIQKYDLPAKASGVFEHYLVKPQSPLVRGFDDRFYAVHSRNTDVRREDVEAEPQLEVVAVSDEVGLYIVKSTDSRRFFVLLPGRRPHRRAAQRLAQPSSAVLHQLAQLLRLPDHALRPGPRRRGALGCDGTAVAVADMAAIRR